MPENNQIQALLAALPEMFPGVQPIPLKNISPNPDNPGAPITEDQIKVLAENIEANGLVNDIRVISNRANPLAGGALPHPDNFRIKTDGQPWELGNFNFLVLTGENRYRAALWLKWETINGKVVNPTAKRAVTLNHADNDVRDRGWWAEYQSIEQLIKADPSLTQREIKTLLKLPLPQVNRAFGLLPLLNPEARALIVTNRNNSNKGNKGISENAVFRLTDLGPGTSFKPGVKKKDPAEAPLGALYPYPAIPPETQELVLRTLKVACDHQMTEKQVQKLIEWVQAGNPPETYAKAPKTPKAKKAKGIAPEALDKALELGKQLGAAEARGEDTAPIQEQLKAFRESLANPSNPSMQINLQDAQKVVQIAKEKAPQMAKDWLKNLWQNFKGLFKNPFKAPAQDPQPAQAGPRGGWERRLHALWHFFQAGAVWIVAFWLVQGLFNQWVLRPMETLWSKITPEKKIESPLVTAKVDPPTPPVVKNSSPSPKVKKMVTGTQPPPAYQPAVSFIPDPSSVKTLYDPKILALEIAAIPKNSVIRDYVYQPDEGMPLDLAVSRLQDLTDPDKYTMMIGSAKQKIISFTPSNTNFILAYQSTDLFGVFGNSTRQMNFFWEDVLYIHTDEIDPADKSRSVIYQCSVVVKNGKNPLTIQCSSSDDLENLVSTLEYFIRHSRLGHDAQPGGMPYPDQGICFNDDLVVTLLWAGSPMDKAGVTLGDHPWSAGKPAVEQETKKNLEKDLSAQGPVTLFVASPAEWNKAQTALNRGLAKALRPKLRKVVLTVS